MKIPVRMPAKCFKIARAVKHGLAYTLLCHLGQSHSHQCHDADHDADHDAWFVPEDR